MERKTSRYLLVHRKFYKFTYLFNPRFWPPDKGTLTGADHTIHPPVTTPTPLKGPTAGRKTPTTRRKTRRPQPPSQHTTTRPLFPLKAFTGHSRLLCAPLHALRAAVTRGICMGNVTPEWFMFDTAGEPPMLVLSGDHEKKIR